jgi:sRNA-binding carbon storage regulator CsrA
MAGLKITRKVGQGFSAFVNGVEIKVIFEQVRGARVGVLRIIAPKSVEILRDELIEEAGHGRLPNSVVTKQVPAAQATQSVSAAIQAGDVG